MSFIRRVLIAGVTTSALATAALVAPGSAQAPHPVIASTKAVGSSSADVAVRPNGRGAVVLSSAGLTKYAISGTSVRRLGTTKIWKGVLPSRHDVLIHPGGSIAYVVWERAIRVFDITGSTPRALRTIQVDQLFGDHSDRAWEGAFAPDGRHLYLLADGWLQVLDTRHPGRPARGKGAALPEDVRFLQSIAVTPNGGALALGGKSEDRATVLVYSLKDSAAPVLARRGQVEVSGWTGASTTSVDQLVARNSSIYVGVATWRDYRESAEYAVLRVRRSDLAVIGQADETEGDGSPVVHATSPAGNLVYLTYFHPSDVDQPVAEPHSLVRTDLGLGVSHHVRVGDVADLAVSPGGRTKGLLAVVVRTGSGLRFELVNAS